MTEIAVVIVNYNTAEMAIDAVQSVLDRPAQGLTVEVHLVDNASPQGDAAAFAQAAQARGWGAQVILYPEAENHGFGRGNNVALDALAARPEPPEFVFLLNPDAMLKNDVLPILHDVMIAHPKACILGTRSFNPGGTEPVTAAFRFPGLASTFAGAVNFGPISRRFAKYEVPLAGRLETQQVGWVSGAAVLARFDVLRDLGFFDPEYFLYYEEVDLMLACARAGWECWHVAEAEIIHFEGAATDVRSVNQRPRRPAYWYHSWYYYFWKNHGRAYALSAALAWVAGAGLNHVLCALRGRAPNAPQGFFRDVWAMVLRPLLGLRAKPY